jgi:hypothetical protein
MPHSSDLSRDDQLYIDDFESIRDSRFNPDLSTKIIIHGWTHGKDVPWVVEMREGRLWVTLCFHKKKIFQKNQILFVHLKMISFCQRLVDNLRI